MALVGSLVESAIASDETLTSLLADDEVPSPPTSQSAAPTRRSSLFANAAAAGLRLSGSFTSGSFTSGRAEAEGSFTATEVARARLALTLTLALALTLTRSATDPNPKPNPNQVARARLSAEELDRPWEVP